MQIGFRDIGSQGSGGSHGTLNVNDATVDIFNLDGGAGVGIGVNGATGVATIENGGKLQITAENVSSDSAYAGLNVGANGNAAHGTGGNGTLTVDGVGSVVDLFSEMNFETNIGNGAATVGTATFQAGASYSAEANFNALIVGRAGGQGLLDFRTGASVALGGDTVQLWIGTAYGDDGQAGDGEVVLQTSAAMAFTGNVNSLNVGGSAGAKGLLKVLTGAAIDMGGGDAYIWSSGAGGSAHAIVEGLGSRLDGLGSLFVGRFDPATIPAGATGKLSVSNGGTVGNTGANIQIAAGGALGGGNGNGTLHGNVNFADGGAIDMTDGLFGTLTFSGQVTTNGALATAFKLDVGASSNDRLIFNGTVTNNTDIALSLTPVAGYKFTKGATKVIATFADPDTGGDGDASLAVLGQQADFSFFWGGLKTAPKNLVFQALNNGNLASAANAGILDFGTTGPSEFVYNSVTQSGLAEGGKFIAGIATKVDDIRGTNGIDNFSVTGTTARTLIFDGRSGNDTIRGGAGADTIKGGIGIDKLFGNNGNDTFLIAGTEAAADTISGGAGTDKIQVTGTAAVTLKNFNARTALVEQWVGNNKGIVGDATINTFDLSALTAMTRLTSVDGASGNDKLIGSKFADTLIGGLGNDTLTGGAGNDFFVFNTALHRTANVDKITDFNRVGNDTIRLENLIFKKLTKVGGLSKDMFVAGTMALDANDHIVYNKGTGALSYDADGSGAAAAIQFASLTTKPTITNLDFLVI